MLTLRTYRILYSIREESKSKAKIAKEIKCLWVSLKGQLDMLHDEGMISITKKGRENSVKITKKGLYFLKKIESFFQGGERVEDGKKRS
jgi:predicted transcriptional regulator